MYSSTLYSNLRNVVSLILFLEMAVCQVAFAQKNDTETTKATTDSVLSINSDNFDILNIELPPLQYFLDAALNAPTVGMFRAMKKEQENRLKLTKNDWLNYLRGVGNYSYGSMGSMTEASATGQSTYFQYYGQTMSLYNVGASVTVPLDMIFNQKTKIKVQESLVEQTNYKLLQAIEDRKIMIIETYSMAVQNLESLRVTGESVAISNSSVKLGELEYINGKIDLAELTSIKRTQALSLITYQEAKTALTVAIQKLELLTNLKIIR